MNTLSNTFKIGNGVRQGTVFAPLLFYFAIDWILLQALSDKQFGLSIDDAGAADLDYADDICLPGDNGNDAQELLNKVVNAASKVGLCNNASKTKFSINPIDIIFCNNEKIEKVDNFTYIGSLIAIFPLGLLTVKPSP